MKPIDWHSMIIRWSAVASAWERGLGLSLWCATWWGEKPGAPAADMAFPA